MFKGQITYESLTLRYPPSVAQFLMEEIEKVEMAHAHANQDVAHDLMQDEALEGERQAAAAY